MTREQKDLEARAATFASRLLPGGGSFCLAEMHPEMALKKVNCLQAARSSIDLAPAAQRSPLLMAKHPDIKNSQANFEK